MCKCTSIYTHHLSTIIFAITKDNADSLIVHLAINYSVNQKTIMVGQDTDLLVLLIAMTLINKKMYFLKPGQGKVSFIVYSSKKYKNGTPI